MSSSGWMVGIWPRCRNCIARYEYNPMVPVRIEPLEDESYHIVWKCPASWWEWPPKPRPLRRSKRGEA